MKEPESPTASLGPRILGLVCLAVVFAALTACTYRNYTGERNPEDIFHVICASGAVLGSRGRGVFNQQVSYRARGAFEKGPVTFDAATYPPGGHNDDESPDEPINERTVSFTGEGGKTYQLTPVLVGRGTLLTAIMAGEYAGYEVRELPGGRLVAVIP